MSTSRMFEDEDITPINKAALLDYIFSENKRVDALSESYVDYLRVHNLNSIGSKVAGLDRWAKKKYHYGALTATTYAENRINLSAEMADFLTTLLNKVVTVDYAKIGPINNHHATYQILSDHFGFNVKTNELVSETTRNGFKTYLENFTVYYCSETIKNAISPDYLNHLGYPATSGAAHGRVENRSREHTLWEEDTTASEDYVMVTLSYHNGSSLTKYTIRLDFLAYEHSGEVLLPEAGGESSEDDPPVTQEVGEEDPDYFMVRYRDASGNIEMFTYRFGSGLYTKLDGIFRKDIDLGLHVPQVYFRLNGRDLYELDDAAAKSSRNYCNKLGFDYVQVGNQIMDSIPSKGDIKDLFISFRLNPNDKDPLVTEYFYYFFEEMYKTNGAKRVSSDERDVTYEYIEGQAKGGMSYSVKDNNSLVNCGFSALGVNTVNGSIGPVGTFKTAYELTEYRGVKGRLFNRLFKSRHIFRKQITSTTYREYYVDGLKVDQWVSSGHWTSANKDSEDLCIPVDLELISKRMHKHKHWLISKSIMVVITSVKVVKKKWYQTGIFKVVMFVVAVVVSFFTGGGGMVWYLALAKAILTTVVLQVAVMAISAILTAMGIDASIVAVVVAVVALAVGAYANATKTAVAGLKAPHLMAISNVSFGVSHNHIALNTKRALQAFEEFKDLMESEMDSIEEQRKLLGLDDGVKLDVYALLARQTREPDIRLGETPLNFYERTLGVNAGLATTAILNNYVFISLQLPSFESFMAKRSGQYEYF